VINGNKIKYKFLLILLITGIGTYSQDLATAKKLWEEKRVVASKEAIDQYLDDSGAEDEEAWLLKAAIYSAICTDQQLKYLVADGRMEVFSAIKKAAALNPKWVTEQLTAGKFELLQVIYKGCTSDGVAFFNAGVERKSVPDYAAALDFFKKAMTVRDFALSQNWKPPFQPNDSILLYNTAQAAINAQKEDDAVLYGRKLADKGIYSAGVYSKADFENIYQWLVNYYNIKKDGSNLQLYAAKGVKIYPGNLYFATISINNYRETGNYGQMLMLYESAIRRFPVNNELLYSYCSDLFTYIYAVSKSVKPKLNQSAKLERSLAALAKAEPDSARAFLLLGKHYYNMAVDLQKAGAGSKKVIPVLRRAVNQLKLFVAKAKSPGSISYKEGLELLVTVLKAVGDKAEAERYNLLLQGI
jgi:hypothetical protein